MNKYYLSYLSKIPGVNSIISIFEKDNTELRFVGGFVRNLVLGRKSKDIDCAINIKVDEVIKILRSNNYEANDYAKKYGCISVIIEDQKFEITSLRKDLNQKGRKTEIEYTNDWKIDANRRDFTFNALYLRSNGEIVDYFEGLKDLRDNKVKFIGDIEKSINEDFLRIFRYYRFLGIFKKPNIIKEYDTIIEKNFYKSFKNISKEIIRAEMLKMIENPYALNSFVDIKNNHQKKYWLLMTEKYFINKKYKLGLEKCLNKIEVFFN